MVELIKPHPYKDLLRLVNLPYISAAIVEIGVESPEEMKVELPDNPTVLLLVIHREQIKSAWWRHHRALVLMF